MRKLLRPVLGLLLGLGVVASLPTYVGLGISFVGMLGREEVPAELWGLYVSMTTYCLAGVIVLLLLSFMTFAQFAAWGFVTSRGLNYGISSLLVALAIVHFAALGIVGEVEERSLFIASSLLYAILLVVLAGLYLWIDWLRSPAYKAAQ